MCKREHVRAPSADVVPVYDGSGENLPLGPRLGLGTGDVKDGGGGGGVIASRNQREL